MNGKEYSIKTDEMVVRFLQALPKANSGASSIYRVARNDRHCQHRQRRQRRRPPRRHTELGERGLPGPITIRTTTGPDIQVVTRLIIDRTSLIGIIQLGRHRRRRRRRRRRRWGRRRRRRWDLHRESGIGGPRRSDTTCRINAIPVMTPSASSAGKSSSSKDE